MDRYVRNFARQAGDQRAIQNVNAKLRTRQYTREQMSAVAKFMEQYNQQDFYMKSPIQEPVMPFAPLPTMVMPPARPCEERPRKALLDGHRHRRHGSGENTSMR